MPVIPIIISFAIGLLIVCAALPFNDRSKSTLLMWISLAFGLGVGVSSGLYFLWLVIVGSAIRGFILLEIAIVGALILYLYRRRAQRAISIAPPRPAERSNIYRAIAIACSMLLVSVLAIELWLAISAPHGAWDAWAIWNLHARFLFRGGDRWRDMFMLADDLHPDYPLLISSIVGRSWQYIGRETTLIPAVVSSLFMFATVGLLGSALARLRSPYHGVVAALLLLGTSTFVYEGASQISDVPLGYFFLATIAMLCFWDRMDVSRFRAALVAGMTAACAAWTKNEGLLFFIVALIVFCAINIRTISIESAGERVEMRTDPFERIKCGLRYLRAFLRQLSPFLVGSLPILLVVICFKAQLSTSGRILAAQNLPTLAAKVTDFWRYWLILQGYLEWSIKFGRGAIIILIAYVILIGRDPGVRSKVLTVMPASFLILMLLGYFAVYLITPYDLAWHISLSNNRLFLQLWPSAIFAAFMVARTPEQMLATTAPRSSEAL